MLRLFFTPLFLISLNYAYILFFILVTTVLELVRQMEGRRQGESKKRKEEERIIEREGGRREGGHLMFLPAIF